MSTIGFISPTPADGLTLVVGQPYTFRVGFVTDEGEGAMNSAEVTVAIGAASRAPDDVQTIGDSGDPAPDFADWTITPTALGDLVIAVASEALTIDGGNGARGYQVAAAATSTPRIGPRLGLGISLGL